MNVVPSEILNVKLMTVLNIRANFHVLSVLIYTIVGCS